MAYHNATWYLRATHQPHIVARAALEASYTQIALGRIVLVSSPGIVVRVTVSM